MAALPPPLSPPNPLPVALPAQPNDPNVPLPAAPGVLGQAVDVSIAERPAAPPLWFQGATQQLRIDVRNDMRDMRDMIADIVRDLNRLKNQRRVDGTVVPYEVIPFTNGDDPTQPAHNLPPLDSINAIQNLNGQDLATYLTGYGIAPLPAGANPIATNRLRKETLKRLVGAL